MVEYRTTLWRNIKARVQWLKANDVRFGEGTEIARALTEELERVYLRIERLERVLAGTCGKDTEHVSEIFPEIENPGVKEIPDED